MGETEAGVLAHLADEGQECLVSFERLEIVLYHGLKLLSGVVLSRVYPR